MVVDLVSADTSNVFLQYDTKKESNDAELIHTTTRIGALKVFSFYEWIS